MVSMIVYYLFAVNLLSFSLYGIDKYKAKKGRWRISEKCLLLLAVAGGSVGAIAGMNIWHHKTQHAKFRIGLPVILALQFLLCCCLFL